LGPNNDARPLGRRSWRGASAAARGERPDKRRWSSRRKTQVVLWHFRGVTPPDVLSRDFRVTPGKLAEWRDEALADMKAGPRSREPGHRDGRLNDRKAKVGNQAMQIEFLKRKIEIPEDGLRPPPGSPSR
jgi:hypothetical protein